MNHRHPLLVLFLVSWLSREAHCQTTVTKSKDIRICNEFGGPDAGAKITACIADLPATGGIADARGFKAAQTISSTITISKPIKLLLCGATYAFTGSSLIFNFL